MEHAGNTNKNVELENRLPFAEAVGEELIKQWQHRRGANEEMSKKAFDWLAPQLLHEVSKQYFEFANKARFTELSSEYAEGLNIAARKDRRSDMPIDYDEDKKDFYIQEDLLNDFGKWLIASLKNKRVVDVAGSPLSAFKEWPRMVHAREYINIDVANSNSLGDIDDSNHAPYFFLKGDMLLTIASMIDESVDVFFLSGIETDLGGIQNYDYMFALVNEISRVLSKDGIVITGFNPELNRLIEDTFEKIREEKEGLFYSISVYKKYLKDGSAA
ncbi:MAG: hypothetical protein Q7S47_01290 [bacterium]|nr:hypothetical protein [bacterium]